MDDRKRRNVIVTESGTIEVEVERSVSLSVPAEWDDEKIRRVAEPKLDEVQWREEWGVISAALISELDRAVGIEAVINEEPEIEDGEAWELPVIVCEEKDIPGEEKDDEEREREDEMIRQLRAQSQDS